MRIQRLEVRRLPKTNLRADAGALDGESHHIGSIASWIQQEIESGRFPPGTKLDERMLCERFGVSKTPIREALIQLSSKGLVGLRQRRGAIVTILTVEQVIAMFEVMTELESAAAKIATSRMSGADRLELKQIYDESREIAHGENPEQYDVANKRFHEMIYRGTGNEFLQEKITEIRNRLRVYSGYPFQKPGRVRQSFKDHGIIVSAILAGDGEAAATAMRDHISIGGRVFADLVMSMGRQG